jgi:dipicolinate synthase subunit B
MGANVLPVMSESVYYTDTRFFNSLDLRHEVETITGNEIIHKIVDAEPLGPGKLANILIIAPCTSNTLAKLASGINDTCVTMSAKSLLRNGAPVVLSISTNDGLSASAPNIGILLNRKNVYFVPFSQDDPVKKQRSLTAKTELIIPSTLAALRGTQIQPILI